MPRNNNTEAAVAQAVQDERARISAILELPEFKGRENLGNAFISKGISIEDAQELLAVAPMASPDAEISSVSANAQVEAMNSILANESPKVAPVAAEQSSQYSQGSAPGEPVSREVALAAARSVPGTRGALRRDAEVQ